MTIVYVILAVLAVFLLIVAMQPSTFCVSRSATMSAPAVEVFPHVNDLHKWEAWSPWAKLDPNAKTNYQGPAAGVGAAFSWAGNHNVGEGRMTITESRPSELVTFQLDFEKPMKGTNTAEFTFKPEGNLTQVTWSMSGRKNFIAKAFGLFVNCDKMVAGQFDKGLADLKKITETKPVASGFATAA